MCIVVQFHFVCVRACVCVRVCAHLQVRNCVRVCEYKVMCLCASSSASCLCLVVQSCFVRVRACVRVCARVCVRVCLCALVGAYLHTCL